MPDGHRYGSPSWLLGQSRQVRVLNRVGDRLLVTYWKDHDLYAALLDPAGGDVVLSAYLCTVAEDRGRESVLALPA